MGILQQWTASVQGAALSAAGIQQTGIDGSQTSTDPSLVSASRKYLVQIKQDQDIQTIGSNKNPIIVVGQVPEEFLMDQQVSWKAPWAAGLAGDGNVADLLAVTMGTRLLAQVQTIQVWQGGGEVEFSLPIEFRAWSDVDKDVMIPLQILSSLAVPSVDPSSGWLRSPGPILDKDAVEKISSGVVSTILDTATKVQNAATKAMANGGKVLAGATAGGVEAASSAGKALYASKAAIEQLLKNKIEIRIGDWFRLKNVIITNVSHVLRPQQPGPRGGIMSATATVSFRPMFALTTDDLTSIIRVGGKNSKVNYQTGGVISFTPD